MIQAVDSNAIMEAGGVWRQVYDQAFSAVTMLAEALAAQVGMAGSDPGALIWGTRYDELCVGPVDSALTCVSVVVNAAGKVSDLLRATSVNHAACDEQSAIGNVSAGAALLPEAPVFPQPVIASAVGGGAAPPAWWLTIQPYVTGGVWPNGNASQLGNAAAAWTTVADALSVAVGLASDATPLLADQQSGEMPNIMTNCGLVVEAINAVIVCCRFVATSCTRYAAAIVRARGRIIDAMQPLNGAVPLGTVPVLIPVLGADGQITAVPRLATEGQLTATGIKISALLKIFLGSAKSDIVVARPLAGANESISKLAPLLQVRPTPFGAAGRNEIVAMGRETRIAKSTEESVIGRLDSYLLDHSHSRGAEKAKWFQRALGFTQENMDFLADQIIFDETAAIECGKTPYGTKFNQMIPIEGANGRIVETRFTWQRDNDGLLRLLTASPTSI